MPQVAQSLATLGVYELTRVELLRDLYVWAYQRATQEYQAIQQNRAEPDPLRLAYRSLIKQIAATFRPWWCRRGNACMKVFWRDSVCGLQSWRCGKRSRKNSQWRIQPRCSLGRIGHRSKNFGRVHGDRYSLFIREHTP